jgi:hypothetical protein|tara:strand:+ start:92 stop:382 length:291 start_codon:yes stop_codon:yes gene_type:complete
MARAKNGTRMAYISLMNEEKESTWITGHYNGFIDTVTEFTVDTLLTESGTVLQTEAAANIELDAAELLTDSEVFSISFVANDNPTPIQTVGEFKVG